MKNTKSQFFGTREETIKWLDKNYIKNYTIHDDLSVDVDDDVIIFQRKLKVIPVKFRKVTGKFLCNNNQLTSLVGTPEFVGGDFWCENNKLTSLVGSPKSVGKSFFCQNNQLINLIESPKSVGSDFYCDGNKLISLMELISSNFKEKFYFNIDENNFKQKELVKILKKYYISKYERYELTNRQFQHIVKPVLERELLEQKLIDSRTKNKTRASFL